MLAELTSPDPHTKHVFTKINDSEKKMCADNNGQYIALYQGLSEYQMNEVKKIVTEFKKADFLMA